MFPIHGTYDQYGNLEDIVKDDNTAFLESYYDLSIEEIVAILTSGRADDGYDGNLKKIMDPAVKYEYGKPVYLERYKELISYSSTWIHGDLYDNLTSIEDKSDLDKSALELGTPALLESLGFKELKEKSADERYDRQFEKDGFVVNSDGTWINIPGEHIYYLKDFKKYLAKKKVIIDITEQDSKSYMEQVYDYVIPKYPEIKNKELFGYMDRMQSLLAFYFLNGEYSESRIKNPLTEKYYELARAGKLRDNFVAFWKFNRYMYSCGRYYDLIGSGPQDGEPEIVKQVLKSSLEIVNAQIKERNSY